MSRLADWLSLNGVHKDTFAQGCGVSGRTVDYWIAGAKKPKFPRTTDKITSITKGEITFRDFYEAQHD